jgi:hypothetical protein
MRPRGWTEAGGALLVEYQSNLACEQVDLLMVWHTGGEEPAGCYDLRLDPDQRIACSMTSDAPPDATPRPSKVSTHFSRPATELPRRDVRVRRARLGGAAAEHPSWTVEIRVAGTWRRVWRGSLEHATADRPHVSVWPNPRGDRAMLLVNYTTAGNGNDAVETAWIALPSSGELSPSSGR